MRRAAIFVLCSLGISASASTDTPAAIVDRLVDFVIASCEYIDRAQPPVSAPIDQDSRKIASHFGKIISKRVAGISTEYQLAVAQWPDWHITYFIRKITLTTPAKLTLGLSDFERRLGPAQPDDVDYAIRPTSTTNRTGSAVGTDFVFRPPTVHKLCSLGVATDGKGRVLSLQLAD
jgi:hypothetical protein